MVPAWRPIVGSEERGGFGKSGVAAGIAGARPGIVRWFRSGYPAPKARARCCKLRLRVPGLRPGPQPRATVSIYHLSFSSISRSQGRSSCAASAYRWGQLGSPITDERLGETFHYPKKRHVVFAALIGWAGDNASLWNKAETAERRRNAVVAREVQVAIPRELSPDSQIALAVAFATFLRETHGVAVDVAVHNPRARDGESQPHAHLLMTTRRVSHDGSFGEKTRELDSLKSRSASVEVIRSSWAAMCNTALEDAGVSERVDHRSYTRQGVDKEAVHANRAAIALEEKGIATAAVAESNRAETRNSRRKAQLAPTTTDATDAIATIGHEQGARRGHR